MNKPTPTPRTDELYRDHMSDPYQDTGDLAAIMHIQCEKLETELTAVTEQRDAASAEFYRYHGLWDRATKQLETVMYQRDRLAAAGKDLLKNLYSMNDNSKIASIRRMKEALQSINQNAKSDGSP